MLRTNLATRPFYNVRAVQVGLGVLFVLVLVVTAYNVVQIVRLTGLEGDLGRDAEAAEAEAARLHAEAARLRAQIDPSQVERLSAAVEEANAIIDQRTFWWTALLAEFERTLPRDMRITQVRRGDPSGDAFQVLIGFEAYDVGNVGRFLQALDEAEAFDHVFPHGYVPADGLIQGTVEALYRPVGAGEPEAQALAAATPDRATAPTTGGPRE